jgi:hypothetical protein
MPIQVTCPGCLKRFAVNDKFAGKTGPCPNCSKPITIPAKSDEVVIHAPDDGGPKDSKGRPVFKPIRRQEVKITLPIALTTAAVSVVVIGVALLVRFTTAEPPTALLVLGALLLAPAIAFAGYWFLRDDELEGFQGPELIVRCGIVALVFAITWAIYAFVPMYVGGFNTLAEIETPYLLFVVPAMILIGALASTLALELEGMQGSLHYLLYFAVTLILALIMGTSIAKPFAESARPTRGASPAATEAGAVPASTPAEAAAKSPPPQATPPAGAATPPNAATPPGAGNPAPTKKPRVLQ